MEKEITPFNAAKALAEEHGIETPSGMPTRGEQDFPEPEYTKNTIGTHMFTWQDETTKEIIRIMIAHLTRTGKNLQATLTVVYRRSANSKVQNLLTGKGWNLNSTSHTESQIRSLNKRLPDRNWDARLALVEEAVSKTIEIGEPLTDLAQVSNPTPAVYALAPLVEANEHNIIAADGGSTKSLLAMAVAVSFSYGKSCLPGMNTGQPPKSTLFLDYESTANTQAQRRRQLVESIGMQIEQGKILYKKMYSPITDAASDLYDTIASKEIGLVIIDSASRAVGGETNSEESVIPFFNACASWGVTVLTIAHKPKDNAGRGPSGVAQWWNQARNYWELVKDQTPGQNEVFVALRHDKANDGQLHEPLNYRIDFNSGIKYYAEDVSSSDLVNSQMPVAQQIIEQLRIKPAQTAKELAEALDKTDKHINNTLRMNEGKLFYGSNGTPRTWSNIGNQKDEMSGWLT